MGLFSRKTTVGSRLAEWSDNLDYRTPTNQGYRSVVKAHLIPYFGELKRVGPEDVRRYVSDVQLSPGVLRNHLIVLQSAGEVGKVKYPRYNPLPQIPSDEEVAKLIERSEGLLHTAVLLAAYGGLRRAEVCGLRWVDVWTDRLLVTQRRWRSEVDLPKSGKPRVVYLPAVLAEELNGLSRTTQRSEYVVPTTTDGLDRRFHRLKRNVGAECTIHGLRHWHASQLARAGVNAKVISERLGHRDVSFTLRTYVHVLPSDQVEAVRVLDLRAAPQVRTSMTTTSASCGSGD